MAVDFDNFPVYDPVTKFSQDLLSDVWCDFVATFIQTLTGYLTQYGIFIPVMTTAQRDTIQDPQEGQMIYVSDFTVGPPRTAEIQVWQVKADVGAWYTFTTV